MRDAVKFLLERIETNPEEFLQDRKSEVKHKWLQTINSYKKFFNEEETKAIQSKLSEINLEHMKTFVVNKLFEQDEEEKETLNTQSLTELVKAFRHTEEAKKLMVNQHQLDAIKMAMKGRYE